MMVTKGFFQVTGKSYSPEAFAGFAGIGHTGMLAGLLLLFFLLRQAILKEPRDESFKNNITSTKIYTSFKGTLLFRTLKGVFLYCDGIVIDNSWLTMRFILTI